MNKLGGKYIIEEKSINIEGAMAFGGGTEEQDEKICRKAIGKVGLYTDVV